MPANFMDREIKIKIGMFVALIAALVVSTGIIGFLLSNNESEIIVSKPEDTGFYDSTNTPQIIAGEDEQEEMIDEIKVYVVGEVKRPGVVTLTKGQIIKDAIDAAGGATDKADIENINLAYELHENVMIKIRAKVEVVVTPGGSAKNPPVRSPVSKPTPSKHENTGFTGIEIVTGSGGVIPDESINTDSSKGKININTAMAEELDTLPGVGPSTANKIVAYREKSGNFKKIEDIMNVPGIGESKFEDMKEFISVK